MQRILLVPVCVLVSVGSLGSAWAGEATGEHILKTPDQLDWQPAASIGDGAEMAIIEGDPKKNEPFTLRLRFEDGLELKPHTHPEAERVTVLSGTLHLAEGKELDKNETQALESGAIAIMPAGMPMFGYAEGETVVQLHGTGPWDIEYLNPKDDPRK